MFEWFWMLPFLQQFLIISLIFAVINFFVGLFLEFGPLASMSPCSGGMGFIFVFVIELVLAVLGGVFRQIYDPAVWLAVPLLGYVWMVIVVIVFAALYQGFIRTAARRMGLKD